jgi:hypothetical protein
MGILDEVLRFEQNERAREEQNIRAVPQALNQFFASTQLARKNMLDEILVQSKVQEAQANARKAGLLDRLLTSTAGGSQGGGASGEGGGFELSGFEIDGFKFDNPARKRQIEQQKQKDELLGKAGEALQTFLSDANRTVIALDDIDEKAINLGDFERRFFNQAGAKTSIFFKEFSKDKDLTLFQGSLNQELAPLTRGAFAEKGPLREEDIERTRKGLGETTAPLADKLELTQGLRGKTIDQISFLAEQAGTSYEEVMAKHPELRQRLERNNTDLVSRATRTHSLRDLELGQVSGPISLANVFEGLGDGD